MVPPTCYSKAASTARKICDQRCKKTFTTQSNRTSQPRGGGAGCASDKLADLLAKGRSFKRRDLSTIHPQQDRFVRADHIFREALFFGFLLRQRARPPCSWARSAVLDMHRQPSQSSFFVFRITLPHPLTCCSQHPRAYLGSCVGAGKRLDQPVRDVRRGAGRLNFL